MGTATTLSPKDSTSLSVDAVYQAYDEWRRRPRAAGRDAHRALVSHLREHVPYYRDRADEWSDQDGGDLPVVDRDLYRAHGNLFEAAVGTVEPYVLTSSGTTGDPLSVTLDAASWYAVNHHFFEQVRRIAELPAGCFHRGQPAVVFVSNKPGRKASVLPLPSLGGGLHVRLQLAQEDAALTLFERLRAPVLYGKPTYLLDLRAALLRAGATRPPWLPELLLVSGEPLHRDDRERLSAYFAAPIVDALASTEGGLVAATRPGGTAYEVFDENVRLEVRGADGSIAGSGAGEIVVTNLVYRRTVFARYRTGDHGELVTDSRDGRQRLVRLQAREPERLTFADGEVATDDITDGLGFLPGLADFQVVVGRSGDTVVRWVAEVPCDDAHALEAAVRRAARDLLPTDRVTVERRARITPPGGKKHRFVREHGPGGS